MSVAIQQGMMEELAELSWMFRQNAALKNGLPDVKRLPVPKLTDEPTQSSTTVKIDETKTETKTDTSAATAATGSPSPGAAAAPNNGKSLWSKAAPFLITGLVAAGLPLGAAWMLGAFDKPKPTTTTTIIAPTQTEAQDRSLLQWLQDHGKHLPGDAKWNQP